jgi:hypothetical protein
VCGVLDRGEREGKSVYHVVFLSGPVTVYL